MSRWTCCSLAAGHLPRSATIARNKQRRRPNAGPPPIPKKVQEAASQRAAKAPTVKRAHGEPVLPSFRSVVIRVLFAAGVFYIMLTLLFPKDGAASIAIQTVILAAIMLPLYWYLDRIVYKRRLRRWQAAQAEKK